METSLRTGHIASGLISVAAIMPQAMGSGKARERRRRLAMGGFSAKRNGQLTDVGMCYNLAMAKQRKSVARSAKTGNSVIGRAHFAKISAVEGIRLTQTMEGRASEADRKGLTAEEHRRTIVRSYRKD